MFSIKQKYEDFDGHEREETLYFHFTEPQLREFLNTNPTFSEKNLSNLIATKDPMQLLDAMQTLIVAGYGEKSADGKVFKKNQEITENFKYSAAFAQLIDDITYKGDFEMLKNFMINMFPAKFAQTIADELSKASGNPEQIEKVSGEVVE